MIKANISLQHNSRELRDADIRGPLHLWLQELHRNDSETSIVHELSIPRPSARVDIAVINGELCGFEIKSDRDSLYRLPRQIESFSSVFDRVAVVTTDRHLKSVRSTIPLWWGIYIARPDGTFLTRRKGISNRKLNIQNLLHLLSKAELLAVTDACLSVPCNRHLRRDAIIQIISDSVSPPDIRNAVRCALKKRASHRGYSSSSSESKLIDISNAKDI